MTAEEKMQRLLRAAKPDTKEQAKRTATEVVAAEDDYEWVYQNLTNASRLHPNDAPSRGAWGLMEWAATSDTTKREFFRLWHSTQGKGKEKERVQAVVRQTYQKIERAIKEFESQEKAKSRRPVKKRASKKKEAAS